MRVGMLAPVAWRVPPRHYGPWEQVVSVLTEGLVRRGVEVTLFATGDSLTGARLDAVVPHPYEEDPAVDAKVAECLHVGHAFERAAAGELDLLHNHFDFLPLTYTDLVQTPVVTTIHGFSSPLILPVYERYDRRVAYVSISDADRSPTLHYEATVHHGIELEHFPAGRGDGGYLLCLGRIHPDKGVAEAIAVARCAGRPLVLAGIVQDAAYHEAEVIPHVDGEAVRYVGPVGPEQRAALLGGAEALLHLVRFAEPFGLAMVEALACGTPVVGRPLGAVPEVVEEGRTGFLVGTTEEAVAAVGRVATIDRGACRRTAEERFSADRMIEDYLAVYERVVSRGSGWT